MSIRQRKELKICTGLSNGPAELLISVVDRVNDYKCMFLYKTTFLHTGLYSLQSSVVHTMDVCCASRELCLFACQTVRRTGTAGPFKAAAESDSVENKRVSVTDRKEIVEMENGLAMLPLIPSDYQCHCKRAIVLNIHSSHK